MSRTYKDHLQVNTEKKTQNQNRKTQGRSPRRDAVSHPDGRKGCSQTPVHPSRAACGSHSTQTQHNCARLPGAHALQPAPPLRAQDPGPTNRPQTVWAGRCTWLLRRESQ